jgi:hypothetical protein
VDIVDSNEKRIQCIATIDKIKFLKLELCKNQRIYNCLKKKIKYLTHAIGKLHLMLQAERDNLNKMGPGACNFVLKKGTGALKNEHATGKVSSENVRALLK